MEEQFPLITLAIPVYNTDEFLENCLKSDITQDYTNLEILVLNNGSTDNSQAIIDKFAKEDKRIVKYIIDHLETDKESKDNTYYLAKGDWIVPLDSEDAIEPGYITTMWKRHIETNADIVVGIMQSVDPDGNKYGKIPSDSFDKSQIITGKEAVSRTLGKWEFGLNGMLSRKRHFVNSSVNNPNCQFYSSEVDTRYFLREAGTVAFTNAIYFHTVNPNSVGQKPRWYKFKYKIDTRRGLLPLVKKDFGIKSKEYGRVLYESLGVLLMTLDYVRKNKNNMSDEEYTEYKALSNDLFSKIEIKSLKHFYYYPIKLFTRIAMSLV
jgi:glycosyltransferase involved in cell wall biosynthesis